MEVAGSEQSLFNIVPELADSGAASQSEAT